MPRAREVLPAPWRDLAAQWATTAAYRRAVHTARATIRAALATSRNPLVSYSGGKDSTALVHLVRRDAPDVLVLHWDYGRAFVPAPVHAEIVANARALGVRRLRIETSPAYAREGRRARNVLGRHLLGRLLPRLAREGYDLDFVGLRAEESLKRRRRIAAGRTAGPLRECWPLATWRWLDVLAYLVEHDLPLLSLYPARAALVGWADARFTTLFDPEFAHLGADAVDGVLHWRWRHAEPPPAP